MLMLKRVFEAVVGLMQLSLDHLIHGTMTWPVLERLMAQAAVLVIPAGQYDELFLCGIMDPLDRFMTQTVAVLEGSMRTLSMEGDLVLPTGQVRCRISTCCRISTGCTRTVFTLCTHTVYSLYQHCTHTVYSLYLHCRMVSTSRTSRAT
jgi:hypothetical protein